eukprot:1966383-Amphidinium_carterae.1
MPYIRGDLSQGECGQFLVTCLVEAVQLVPYFLKLGCLAYRVHPIERLTERKSIRNDIFKF